MGRQQYLERVALGRSAFEDPDTEAEVDRENGTPRTQVAIDSDGGDSTRSGQQYDSKGRPINPLTEERNAALRNAQNAVLSLVGVVESKDESDRLEEAKSRPIREARERMLENEHQRGEDLSVLAPFLHRALTWWPDTLLARVQAGLYASSWSFADILLHELGAARHNGLKSLLLALLPGMAAHAACTVLDALLCGALVEVIGSLENRLNRKLNRRASRKYLKIGTTIVMEVLCGAVSVVLLPLEYHAETQRLGLAPAWPLLPSWRVFLPTMPSSTHGLIWSPKTKPSWLGMLSSPALLLILQKSLTRYQGEESPLASQFTTFEYPAVNTPVSSVRKPDIGKDPLGRFLYHGYLLRTRILKWSGWNLVSVPERPQRRSEATQLAAGTNLAGNQVEKTSSSNNVDEMHRVYRSTSLSELPTKYLAERIDVCLTGILMLPFESMLLRAIARSYLTSPLPKTSLTMATMHNYYSPFGGGPLGGLASAGLSITAWRDVGSYLSKLGLSLALHYSTEVGIFFFLYRVHRWQGLRNFEWGSAI